MPLPPAARAAPRPPALRARILIHRCVLRIECAILASHSPPPSLRPRPPARALHQSLINRRPPLTWQRACLHLKDTLKMRILILSFFAAAALGIPHDHLLKNRDIRRHGRQHTLGARDDLIELPEGLGSSSETDPPPRRHHHALAYRNQQFEPAQDLESETAPDAQQDLPKLERQLVEKQLREVATWFVLADAEARGEDLERYVPSTSGDFERVDESELVAWEAKLLRVFYLDTVADEMKPQQEWAELERDPETLAREMERVEEVAHIPTGLKPAELREWLLLDCERRGFWSGLKRFAGNVASKTVQTVGGALDIGKHLKVFSQKYIVPMIQKASRAVTTTWKMAIQPISTAVKKITDTIKNVRTAVRNLPKTFKRYVAHYVQEKMVRPPILRARRAHRLPSMGLASPTRSSCLLAAARVRWPRRRRTDEDRGHNLRHLRHRRWGLRRRGGPGQVQQIQQMPPVRLRTQRKARGLPEGGPWAAGPGERQLPREPAG